MIYVIYHAHCLDGFGAAYAAWRKFGDEAEYVEVRYGDPWPASVVAELSEIYILDFSFDRDELLYQHELATKLIVLDHHKSAEERLEGLPFAQFNMELSGAVMAWRHFHSFKDVPQLLLHVQDRDLWRFDLQSTEAICEALWAYPRDFDRWDHYIQDKEAFRRLKNEGRLLLLAKKRVVQQACYGAFVRTVQGRMTVACNTSIHVSEVCHELLSRFPECEFAVGFRVTKERLFRWEFRSRKNSGVDVSEVAKLFEGGGHENAAGAITEDIILEELK